MFLGRVLELVSKTSTKLVQILVLWPNSGLSGGSDGTGSVRKRKAAVVLVLLAKEMWLAYRDRQVMNRMARIVPDPNRTYAGTRTAVQLCGSHLHQHSVV